MSGDSGMQEPPVPEPDPNFPGSRRAAPGRIKKPRKPKAK